MDKERGLTLVEIADGLSVQDIVEATECEFEVRADNFYLIFQCIIIKVTKNYLLHWQSRNFCRNFCMGIKIVQNVHVLNTYIYFQ